MAQSQFIQAIPNGWTLFSLEEKNLEAAIFVVRELCIVSHRDLRLSSVFRVVYRNHVCYICH